jgi:hypothetical protein
LQPGSGTYGMDEEMYQHMAGMGPSPPLSCAPRSHPGNMNTSGVPQNGEAYSIWGLPIT